MRGADPDRLGRPAERRTARHLFGYSDISPSRLLPNGAKTIIITGAADRTTVPAYAQTYTDEVKAAGGAIALVIVPDAGHFDVVTTSAPAWRLVSERIVAALKK